MIQAQLADGTTLEFPDDTPDDVVDRVVRGHMAPAAPERGVVDRVASAAGQFGAGANQGIASAIGGPFDLVNRGLRAVGVPIPEGSVTGAVQGGINAVVGEPAAPQGTGERLLRGAGRGLIDAATFALPAAGLARATASAAPGLTNRVAEVLASQPGLQAASGMAGGAVGEATGSPLAGAAAALATPLAAAGAGRLISPVRPVANTGREALVAAAERERIPVTAGQATGSRFLQNVEGQLEELPFTNGRALAQRRGQQEAFTAAALRRTGEEATDASPATLQAVRSRLGATFDDLSNRNTLNLDDETLDALGAMERRLVEDNIQGVRGPVMRRMNEVLDQGAEGAVSGNFYRQMDSDLGATARGTTNGDYAMALRELRDILRNGMDRGISPEDAAAWAQVRREYANFKNIQRAMNGGGGNVAEGQLSPQMLRGAVNNGTGGGYSMGQGDLNELARVGQSVLRAPPNSGTTGRAIATAVLTGGLGGAALGGTTGSLLGTATTLSLPPVIQALMSTQAGQRYLRNQLVQGGQLGPGVAAVTGQQGAAYLNRPGS